jgi:hypothetical protein
MMTFHLNATLPGVNPRTSAALAIRASSHYVMWGNLAKRIHQSNKEKAERRNHGRVVVRRSLTGPG